MPIRCPTCDSPDPRAHPAVSGGGEVTRICPDPYHLPIGRDITGIFNAEELQGRIMPDHEPYIPNKYDYAKAEWMAEGLPEPEPLHGEEPFYCEYGCMPMDHGVGIDTLQERILSGKTSLTEAQAEVIEHVYNTMIHRETGGSDPLVQEPKGKP